MNNKPYENLINNFRKNTTTRLSFRNTDYLLHFRYTNIFSEKLSILDMWELKSGDCAVITNRKEDLPNDFKLHPSEVCNSLIYELLDSFNNGDYPPEPMDAINLWRVRAGDTIVWVGDDRPDIKSDQGILQIYKFSECALLYGEPKDPIDMFTFGSNLGTEIDKKSLAECQRAVAIVRTFGLPRTLSPEWQLG